MTPVRLAAFLAPLAFGRGFRITKPEDVFGYAVANMLRAEAIEGRLKAVFFHVANEVGGKAGSKGASLRYVMARALGLLPGTFDLIFLTGRRAVVIELKAGKNRLSDTQKLFAEWCGVHGVPTHVVTAKDDADIPRAVKEVRDILVFEGLLPS